MARVCAPVTIVSTGDGEGPHGATVSSFVALSIEPPLITVAFEHRSSLLRRIANAGRFGVNLLGHGQDDLATLFARRGADRFRYTAWHYDSGLPRVDGAAGWLACELHNTIEGGDHVLLFGLVSKLANLEVPPLVYANRTFGTHSHFFSRPRPPIADSVAAFRS
jgi:flavin reductase (DIM6/NTAB) family NADH-FMN oxidoreductase RutF